jgi:hypothetical protein
MSLPNPPVILKNHCSVVYRNTLYTLQPDAFQSLDLRPGGGWSQLPLGVPTNGSVCVQASPNGQDSLFVVGGVTNSSSPAFSGLQRFIFQSRRWETIAPVDLVTKNRLGHAAVYLNASSTILIYAGSQDGTALPSSETFTISTTPPYSVIAHSSSIVPPSIKPLLLPWNASHALMLGGDPQNKNLFTFGPGSGQGWRRMDRHLKAGLKDSSKEQAAIFVGDDGSKTLEIFDMNASPNRITTVPLQPPTEPMPPGTTTKASPSSISSATPTQQRSRKRKRETPGRPAYNGTFAPEGPRDGFSLAADPDGLIVVSGGVPPNSDDVVCLFNQTANAWIDPTQFLVAVGPDSPSSTTVAPSSTASITQTPAPATARPAANAKNRSLKILGATLGAVFGLVALLVIVLLVLRRRRNRTRARHSGDYSSDAKKRVNFGDGEVTYMRHAGAAAGGTSTHKHMDSGHSITSMAIMSGRAHAGSSQSKRAFLHKPDGSNGSSKSFFSRGRSPLAPSPPLISGPIPVEGSPERALVQTTPEPRTEPRTDTGWSRYFANNSSTSLSNVPPGSPHHDRGSQPSTYTSGSNSDYASSRIASSNLHESAEVPPLSVRTNVHYPPHTRLVSPTSGLPLAQPGLAFSSGISSHDTSTPSTLVSEVNEDDEYRQDEELSHGSGGMQSWTPIAASERGSTWEDRPISSIYADGPIYAHPGERVRIPNFPPVPSTTRNSTTRNSQAESLGDIRGMRSVASRDLRSPHPDEHERELREAGIRRAGAQGIGDDERGAGPGFPGDGDSDQATPRAGEVDDMSWLNLGR